MSSIVTNADALGMRQWVWNFVWLVMRMGVRRQVELVARDYGTFFLQESRASSCAIF
jgi:hypothetical protein